MASGKTSRPRHLRIFRLVERSVRSFSRHDMAVYAMALAYRGLLALFPFALFLVAAVGFLRVDAVLEWLAEQGPPGIRGTLPRPVESLLAQVLGEERDGLLYLGVGVAFWSVSMGARILTRALNAVLEVEDARPSWKKAAASLVFAPGLALAVVSAAILMLATSRSAAWVAGWVGLDAAFVFLWALLRWPVALVLLALVVATVYRYAPGADLPFRSVLPGAVFAVVSWGSASLALSFLLGVLPDYGSVYGSLGTAISLLLYLYFSAIVLLFGAELNAAMRRGAPKGERDEPKAP